MKQTRREFLITVVTVSVGFSSGTLLAGTDLNSFVDSNTQEAPQIVGGHNIIHARANTDYSLPKNPPKDALVYIKVGRSSMSNPAKLKFSGDTIVGFREDVILDSMCILRLRFAGSSDGWVLV